MQEEDQSARNAVRREVMVGVIKGAWAMAMGV